MEKLSNDMKNEIIFLIKFSSKERLEQFQKGNIYMKNFQYFIELEKLNNQKGKGDSYEAGFLLNALNVKIMNPDTKEVILNSKAGKLMQRREGDNRKPVLCLSYVTINTLYNLTDHEKGIIGYIKYRDEDIEEIKREFGEYALLIEYDKFIQAISKKLDKEKIAYLTGKVRYSDFNTNLSDRVLSCNNNPNEVFFWKHSKLKYQREFRLVLTGKEVEDHYTFNIGNMKDFSYIFKVDDLLSGNYGIQLNLK